MEHIFKADRHWIVIQTTESQPSRWTALWALYASQELAIAQVDIKRAENSLVAGGVGMFFTESEARARAELDATRTSAVISGTYRD